MEQFVMKSKFHKTQRKCIKSASRIDPALKLSPKSRSMPRKWDLYLKLIRSD